MWILASLAILGMFLFMLFRRNKFHISLLKTVVVFILLACLGILSTQILYFIENGEWGGMSFFGAVLFVPIWFFAVAKILNIPFSKMMDFVALPGLLMFAVLKANCAVEGCCQGRVLCNSNGVNPIYFPSPIVEAITTVLLVCALLCVEKKGKTNNKLYPISLASYGVLRFVLNFFREQGEPLFLGLQKGNVWALVAILVGAVWLLVLRYMEINSRYNLLIKEKTQK